MTRTAVSRARESDELPAFEPEAARERVFLRPGEIVIALHPHAIRTILGSCVSVCLYDPGRRIGAINHFLLPKQNGADPHSARFGDVAVPRLLRSMFDLGSHPQTLEASVFGGASILVPKRRSQKRTLGLQNADVAIGLLERAGVEILQTDVGGGLGRRLEFHSDSGRTHIKWLGGGAS